MRNEAEPQKDENLSTENPLSEPVRYERVQTGPESFRLVRHGPPTIMMIDRELAKRKDVSSIERNAYILRRRLGRPYKSRFVRNANRED